MQRHLKRLTVAGFGTVVTALLLAGCGSTTETLDTSEDMTLSFRSDVYFNGALLPVVAGVEQGIFEEHGVNLEIQEGTGSATTIQTVANQSDDIGFADAAALVQNRAQGVEAKMFYNVIAESPLTIYARSGDGITETADLAGKRGGYTSGSAAEVLFPAYLNANSMTEDEIDLVNVDIPTRNQLFLAGETDFTFGLTNISGPSLLSSCDCELETLAYSEAGVNPLGSGFIVSDDFAEKNPEALSRFVEAYEEAVAFTNEDPGRAAEMFLARATESTTSKDVLVEQWEATYGLKDREGSEDSADGCMADSDWTETISLMEEYAEVPEGNVSASDIMTNETILGGCGE